MSRRGPPKAHYQKLSGVIKGGFGVVVWMRTVFLGGRTQPDRVRQAASPDQETKTHKARGPKTKRPFLAKTKGPKTSPPRPSHVRRLDRRRGPGSCPTAITQNDAERVRVIACTVVM